GAEAVGSALLLVVEPVEIALGGGPPALLDLSGGVGADAILDVLGDLQRVLGELGLLGLEGLGGLGVGGGVGLLLFLLLGGRLLLAAAAPPRGPEATAGRPAHPGAPEALRHGALAERQERRQGGEREDPQRGPRGVLAGGGGLGAEPPSST